MSAVDANYDRLPLQIPAAQILLTGVRKYFVLIAISEMVAANNGIGFMIWNAWQVLTVDTMYVGLLVIAILGFVFSVVLDEIERRLIPWKSGA